MSQCHDTGRRWPVLAWVFACAMSAGAFELGAQPPGAPPPDPVGEMVEVRNEVMGTAPGSPAAPLAVGDELVLDHLVETRVAAEARMGLGAGGREGELYLGPRTRVTLDRNLVDEASRRTSTFSVLLGVIRLKLTALFSGEIDIETPTATVGVKGTEVQVEVDEDGQTTVTVFEGVVTLLARAGGDLVRLTAGQSSVVRPGETPSPPEGSEPGQDPGGDSETEPGADSGPDPGSRPGPDLGPGSGDGRSRPDPGKGEDGRPPEEPPANDEPSRSAAGSCPARAQAGEQVCVCGTFPASVLTAQQSASPPRSQGRRGRGNPATPATGFSLDDRTPLTVVSHSPSHVNVRLPRQMEAGRHTLNSPAGSCRLDVLVLDAGFDGPLKQGRAPKYEIRVEGTRERLRIQLENRTPNIIRIRGGNNQVLTTSGGRNNRARVRVKAIADGDAILATTILGLPQCPCAVTAK